MRLLHAAQGVAQLPHHGAERAHQVAELVGRVAVRLLVEPPFGQIKNRGFRGFLLRGIEKVRGEWSLITLTHNLLKLHRVCVAA